MSFVIRAVPDDIVAAETDRFSGSVVDTIIQASRLPLVPKAVAQFCWWFVGRDSWWVLSRGDHWSEQRGLDWPAFLGDHLAEERLGWPLFSLHMTCKSGRYRDAPYYWTRHLAIDIDYHLGESAWLRSRYDLCVNALGIRPVVVSTPRDGLRLLYPLAEPVSVFGFSQTEWAEFPPLIPSLLKAAKVPLRSGEVEIYPLRQHTVRLPLAPTTVQLDPETLEPLPPLPRHEELSRLMTSIEYAAEHTPLDAFALAATCSPSLRQRTRNTTSRQPRLKAIPAVCSPEAAPRPGEPIDVDRLEANGLYPGVRRNEAAMAIARRKMLGEGWSAEQTVDYLRTWTVEKTNGLSSEAPSMGTPKGDVRLTGEYQRVCKGIERAVANGSLPRHTVTQYGPISEREATWIIDTTRDVEDPGTRYSLEVFLFSLTGVAKDRGARAIGPARYQNAVIVHVPVSAAMMQRWPGCGAGRYKQRLTWACEQGLTRMVVNYRHSQNPALSRARSFEFDVEPAGSPAVSLEPTALTEAAQQAAAGSSGRRVHPRQVEHAVIVAHLFGELLEERYGLAAANRIGRLANLSKDIESRGAVSAPESEAA